MLDARNENDHSKCRGNSSCKIDLREDVVLHERWVKRRETCEEHHDPQKERLRALFCLQEAAHRCEVCGEGDALKQNVCDERILGEKPEDVDHSPCNETSFLGVIEGDSKCVVLHVRRDNSREDDLYVYHCAHHSDVSREGIPRAGVVHVVRQPHHHVHENPCGEHGLGLTDQGAANVIDR